MYATVQMYTGQVTRKTQPCLTGRPVNCIALETIPEMLEKQIITFQGFITETALFPSRVPFMNGGYVSPENRHIS